MVNLSNITGKLTKNAEMLGSLYGYLAPMAKLNPSDPWGQIFTEHEQLLTGFQFPTIDDLKYSLDHSKEFLKTALMLYIAGEIGSGFGGDIGKYAKTAKKVGMGIAKGTVASIVVMAMGGAGLHAKYPGMSSKTFNRVVVAPNQGYGY